MRDRVYAFEGVKRYCFFFRVASWKIWRWIVFIALFGSEYMMDWIPCML